MQEKDRLKKEMLMRLRETKANLLRMTDSHVSVATHASSHLHRITCSSCWGAWERAGLEAQGELLDRLETGFINGFYNRHVCH